MTSHKVSSLVYLLDGTPQLLTSYDILLCLVIAFFFEKPIRLHLAVKFVLHTSSDILLRGELMIAASIHLDMVVGVMWTVGGLEGHELDGLLRRRCP